MSKGQFDAVGGRRGPESGFIAPEDVRIVELLDENHPKHGMYRVRLDPNDPEIVAFADDMDSAGWPTGSIAFLYRDGPHVNAATARRRITAACIVNRRRKERRDKRGRIEVPFLWTKDPATAEAIENAGRVDIPLMQTAREYVGLRDALGDARKAAAMLRIPLATANALEKCLTLPVDVQAKINSHELPVDVAARLGKVGSDKAREIVSGATGEDGKVDERKARKAAKAETKRARGRSAKVARSVAAECARMGEIKDGEHAPDRDRYKTAAAVIEWFCGGNAPAWLARAVESAEAARKGKRVEVKP